MRKQSFPVWKENFSLGAGLLFLSTLAFTSPASYPQGTLVFLLGLYFLIRGRHMQERRRATLNEFISLKVLQSLVLIALGIVLMNVLPENFLGTSFLLVLIGTGMFLSYKARYLHAR